MNKNKQRQKGVTLLLGMLIMGSLLAISLSVATILLVEIKSSGDLALTETVYQGSLAVGEEKLFEYKRNVPSGSTTPTTAVGSKVSIDIPVVSSTTTPIVQIKIPKEDTNFTSASVKLFVYDPVNSAGPSNYGLIKVTYLSTGATQNLVVYLCEFDPLHGLFTAGGSKPPTTACQSSDSAYEYWPYGSQTLTSNSTLSQSIISTKQQMIIIYNASSSLNDAYVQIQTFADSEGTIPKGLPFSGYKTININAKNSGINRKIQFLMPN